MAASLGFSPAVMVALFALARATAFASSFASRCDSDPKICPSSAFTWLLSVAGVSRSRASSVDSVLLAENSAAQAASEACSSAVTASDTAAASGASAAFCCCRNSWFAIHTGVGPGAGASSEARDGGLGVRPRPRNSNRLASAACNRKRITTELDCGR